MNDRPAIEPAPGRGDEAAPLTFRDVPVVPYTDLLDGPNGGRSHRGGPVWPQWDRQTIARHRRRDVPVDTRPEVGDVADWPRLEPMIWGGPISHHFGHQIADYSNRLLRSIIERPDLPVAFATKAAYGMATIDDAPPFFGRILDWFGLPRARRRLITQPGIVDELVVFPQAEQLAMPGPSSTTLDRLDELTRRRLGDRSPASRGTIYVSRAGQIARFAGEAYLETVLASAGLTIIRPEDLDLVDQLRCYRDAERLVFAEGSALHALQLMGRTDVDVAVFVRRPKKRRAMKSLAPRVAALRYVESSRGLVHGERVNGKAARSMGICVLDDERIIAKLRRNGLDVGRRWDARRYLEARDDDVRAWLATQGKAERSHHPPAIDAIVSTLGTCGLGHLVDEAMTLTAP